MPSDIRTGVLKVATLAVACFFVLCLPIPGSAGVPGFMKARMGTLAGSIVLPGLEIPQDGVIVALFQKELGPPPTEAGMRRIPEMVSRSDAAGAISVELLPGSYYVGALIRAKGESPGPPRPGEKFFFAHGEDGGLATYSVATKTVTEAGEIRVREPKEIKEIAGGFVIEGVVTDEEGKPYAGALILAKDNPEISRPLFISEPTDEQGRYRMTLPSDRVFYLFARQSILAGRPVPGSYVGVFGKTAPSQGTEKEASFGGRTSVGVVGQGGEGEALEVKGKAGEVLGKVDITMFKLPDPEENRKKYQKLSAPVGAMESQGEVEGETAPPPAGR
ncbi:MAG: hypothetical protein AB1568_07925 [Thermodesulfobacteriota bacterium]